MTALTKPIEKYESMRFALTGLADKTKKKYVEVVPRFCEFVGKDPDQLIAERKEQELIRGDDKARYAMEQKVTEFYEHLKRPEKEGGGGVGESTAFIYCATVRGFFSRNRCQKLSFRRGDMRTPMKEKEDWKPTMGELKEICDAADIRDRAIIILAMQTGAAPTEIVNLQRANFEPFLDRETPVPLGWLQRHKSRVKFHPFLFADSARALKRYLANRKDNSPHLFVDRSGQPFQERSVNDLFVKAVKRAGIKVPHGLRCRVYCLRSIFETQMGNGGMPQTWIDMMMGHIPAGSRGKYVAPPETDWLEKARKAEPFISISRVRNMDVLRTKIDEARKGDMLELIVVLHDALGPDLMKQISQKYLALKPMIPQGDEDLTPSPNVLADALSEYFGAGRKRKRSAHPSFSRDKK